jgi:hypothetical protein
MIIRSTSSPVPTGTVDLVTTTEALESRGNLARCRINVTEIGVTVTPPRRRADRDEHRIGLRDRICEIGYEGEPPCFDIGGY